MWIVIRDLEISAAHMLPGYPGDCARLSATIRGCLDHVLLNKVIDHPAESS